VQSSKVFSPSTSPPQCVPSTLYPRPQCSSEPPHALIKSLTGNATGTTYTWTPSSSLSSGDNYALQITQGINDVNYSGQFTIVGGSSTTAANSTAPATTAVIIAGPSGTTTVLGNATAIITVLSSGTGTALPRNTTFSSQMLSTDTAATMTTSGATGGVVAGSPTGTAGASGASASASPTGGASQMAGSSLALVFCAAVGMWVLN
jgi:hypothetical protein